MVTQSSNIIEGPAAHSPLWYAMRTYDPIRVERPVIFGGSDAAAAMGISPYTSPLELFLRKRGALPDTEENAAMRYGKRMERVNLEWYEEDEQTELLYDLPMYFSVDHPFMAITPDALRPESTWHIGVEAKASNKRMQDTEGEDVDKYGEPGTDEVPRYIMAQCQQYCAVLGVARVDVTVLFGMERSTYRVEANHDFIETLIAAEKELAERIINDDPPEPSWSLPETAKLLQQMYGVKIGESKQLSEEAADLWRQRAALKDSMKLVQERVNELSAHIQQELGEAQIGILPNGKQQIKRVIVKDSKWTHSDIAEAEKKLGTIKRKGHERLQLVLV